MLLRMCKCVMVVRFVWLTSSKSEEEALGGISLKEGGDAAGHSFVAFVNEFLSQVTVNLLCCQALLSWQGTVDEMRKLRQNKRENCYYRPGLNLSLCMSEKLGSWDIYATLWNVTATHTQTVLLSWTPRELIDLLQGKEYGKLSTAGRSVTQLAMNREGWT